MSEVKRSEEVLQKKKVLDERRQVTFSSNKIKAIISTNSSLVGIKDVDEWRDYYKRDIPDLIAVLQAVQNELEPQKKVSYDHECESDNFHSEYNSNEIYFCRYFQCIGDNDIKFDIKLLPEFVKFVQDVRDELDGKPKKKDASADKDVRSTNKIKFTTVIDGVERECYAWLERRQGRGFVLGISENKDYPMGWRVLRITEEGKLVRTKCFFCKGILSDSLGQIIIEDDDIQPTPKKKPLITAADWRDYFTNESDMMSYNVERAKAEFKNRIKHIYKLGWQNGKAEVANYISMKKWIAKANGNTKYGNIANCGYCFVWKFEETDEGKCPNCLYEKIYNCNIAEPDEMIRRFQNPELLKLIEEYDREMPK